MSIMGPYGSGKSTFGVLLNCILAPSADPSFEASIEKIRVASPDIAHIAGKFRKDSGIVSNGMMRCTGIGSPGTGSGVDPEGRRLRGRVVFRRQILQEELCRGAHTAETVKGGDARHRARCRCGARHNHKHGQGIAHAPHDRRVWQEHRVFCRWWDRRRSLPVAGDCGGIPQAAAACDNHTAHGVRRVCGRAQCGTDEGVGQDTGALL